MLASHFNSLQTNLNAQANEKKAVGSSSSFCWCFLQHPSSSHRYSSRV